MANLTSKDFAEITGRKPAPKKQRAAGQRQPSLLVPKGPFATQYDEQRFAPFLEPACRWCGCSHHRPCPTGCTWTVQPDEPTGPVCNICAQRGQSLRVLAIDPSIVSFGWCVLDVAGEPKIHERRVESGVWHPSKREDLPDRFIQMARFVAELVYYFLPTDVLVEMPHKGQRGMRNFNGLMIYSNAAGVVAGVAAGMNRRTWRIGVTTWKGTQKKSETARTVSLLMPNVGESSDENDAAGMALFYASRVAPVLLGKLPKSMLPPPAF